MGLSAAPSIKQAAGPLVPERPNRVWGTDRFREFRDALLQARSLFGFVPPPLLNLIDIVRRPVIGHEGSWKPSQDGD